MIKFFRKKLPHCDDLFARYLAPWCPDEYGRNMTRPDMYVISGYEGRPIDLGSIQYLSRDRLQTEKDQIKRMEAAALEDYQSIFPSTALTVDLLDAVDRFYDRQRIADLIKRSDPRDFSNDYLVSVGQFGVLLGKLFEGIDGFGITVFDWAVKKFSEYGVDDGFAAKFQAAAEGVWRKG